MIKTMLNRFQQPEYTGENRCIPCTSVNIIIALVVSRLIATRSRLVGWGSFSLFTGVIYLRGYLVPGTPTLTKRYFPNWLLQLFNKQPTDRFVRSVDVELKTVLQRAGAIQPCPENELCLTESFRAAWTDRIDSLRDHDFENSQFANLLDSTEERIATGEIEDGTLLVLNDEIIAQWESDAAILADVAAGRELRERSSDWSDLTPEARCHVLRGLRAFADTCPMCGGNIYASEDTVESCCGISDVTAVHCSACDSRLLEIST